MKRSIMGLIYLIQGIESLGIDIQSRLQEIGIDAKQLDPTVLIHRELEWAIQQHIAKDIDPALGLLIGQHYALSGYGPFLMLLLTAKNVHAAFEIALKFDQLTYVFGRLDYTIDDENIWLHYLHVPDTINDLRTHAEISGTYKFIKDIQRLMALPDMGISAKLSLAQPTSLEQMRAYKTYYGEHVCFGEKYTSFGMSKEILNFLLATADPIMHEVYREKCLTESLRMQESKDNDINLIEKIRDYLNLQNQKIPSLNEVTKALSIPERTLRHRLTMLNTSFKQIKENILKQKAQKLLLDGKMNIEQVAYTLGYAEPAAFNHAFKRWYQCSPKQYIKQNVHIAE